jgi:hypothetical protein
MKYLKAMAYWGAMLGGSLYTVKMALYVYRNKGKITVDGLVNL